MRNRWIRRLTGGAGLLAAAVLAVAADTSAKDALPPDVAAKVAEADIAFLQKGLDKDLSKNKRDVPTLKATAVMIALYAQNNDMGGLQTQALKVAEAIGKKDYAAAKTAAAGLSKAASGTSSGGKAAALHEQSKLDIAEVMSVFRPTKTGGLNIEKDIKDQSKKVTDVKLASAAAVNTLWAGHFTQLLPTDKAGSNASNKKKWEGYTADMNKVAEEITAEAVRGEKADKSLLAKKLKALDGSCVACHNDFRE